MIKIRASVLALLSLLIFSAAHAQTDTLRVKTSAVCTTCKKTIEHDLSYEKGVKSSSLDVDSKIVTVIYNPKKTDPQKIREAITNIGYDADTLKRNPKSFDKLPECCKNPDQH